MLFGLLLEFHGQKLTLHKLCISPTISDFSKEQNSMDVGFSFNDVRNKEIWLPRVEVFCQFKRQVKFNDLLEVELPIGELKEKSKVRLQNLQ